ncbi:hypothetical protein M9H77_12831 [Catharanthus roseus]|uniref:Uncharacterized protein n=1 Tax=Catharanthus roseus TaxID=4058 RepID=A0ACC0BIK9_CATRO|nr:hypothetical protein M9H77_12831 [Catharanthus roseus]
MKFLFYVSNNEAKYKALLAGLCMVKSINLTQLLVQGDSQVKPSIIKEGDLVLRKNKVSKVDPNRKLDPTWEGPYRVIKVNEAYKAGGAPVSALKGSLKYPFSLLKMTMSGFQLVAQLMHIHPIEFQFNRANKVMQGTTVPSMTAK